MTDSMFAYAVAGAMVSELLLRGALRIEQVKKKKMLAIGDPRPVGCAFSTNAWTEFRRRSAGRTLRLGLAGLHTRRL